VFERHLEPPGGTWVASGGIREDLEASGRSWLKELNTSQL
jgi:hypothetical protein